MIYLLITLGCDVDVSMELLYRQSLLAGTISHPEWLCTYTAIELIVGVQSNHHSLHPRRCNAIEEGRTGPGRSQQDRGQNWTWRNSNVALRTVSFFMWHAYPYIISRGFLSDALLLKSSELVSLRLGVIEAGRFRAYCDQLPACAWRVYLCLAYFGVEFLLVCCVYFG